MYLCVAVSGVWWIPTNVSVCGCEWCVVVYLCVAVRGLCWISTNVTCEWL